MTSHLPRRLKRARKKFHAEFQRRLARQEPISMMLLMELGYPEPPFGRYKGYQVNMDAWVFT